MCAKVWSVKICPGCVKNGAFYRRMGDVIGIPILQFLQIIVAKSSLTKEPVGNYVSLKQFSMIRVCLRRYHVFTFLKRRQTETNWDI